MEANFFFKIKKYTKIEINPKKPKKPKEGGLRERVQVKGAKGRRK